MPSPAGGPMKAWLDILLDTATHVWAQPAEQWIDDSAKFEDTELVYRETKGDSAIDKQNLRQAMVNAWKAGQANLFVRELPGRTRVLFLGTPEQFAQVPWNFWSRIFMAIGHPVGYVVIYASPELRTFPPEGTAVEAEHINGGYSFLCQQSLVVVYRFEELTRVLLHELLHTACFDNGKPVEHLEANTEAWTEVFLCSLLSRGSKAIFMKLWKQQCAWMDEQAARLAFHHGVNGEGDYAWRYFTGKVKVLQAHGFYVDCKTGSNPNLNLRMTTPEWDPLLFKN